MDDKHQQMKMQYLGVLKLLAESSLLLRARDPEGLGGSHEDVEEFRDQIERALNDGRKVISRLRVRRIIHRFELDLVDEDEPDEWPTHPAAAEVR